MSPIVRVLACFSFLLLGACKLTVVNEGGGVVMSKSGEINCGNDCVADYGELSKKYPSAGSSYTEVLVAHPSQGYEFAGWSGDCSGQSTCSVTISGTSGDKNVTATFREKPVPVDAKDITAFRFYRNLNPGLQSDLVASIDQSARTIATAVPFGVDRSALVASFEHTGTSVFAYGVEQQSAVTPNNFSVPVDYSVLAIDGTTKTYRVTVSQSSCPEKVLQGPYRIETQAHIDALKGYTTISGDLLVGRSDGLAISLTSLRGLECLSRVSGSFSIRQETGLRDLSGLNNLASINGSLIIDTTGLTSLNGLDRLASTGVDLVVRNNPGLASLNGLASLAVVSGRTMILDNPNLESIEGLQGVTRIQGELRITNNPMLQNLQGLSALTSLAAASISNNSALTELSGLDGVTVLSGGLTLTNNGALTDLNGLQGVTRIGAGLNVSDNGGLVSMSALSQLATVGGSLQINRNNTLNSLGLTALCRTQGSFQVTQNPQLCTREAEALRTQVQACQGIGGTVSISGNAACP